MRTVVGLLRQTEKVIAKFDLQRQHCTGLALELGVPPRMRLLYTDKDKPSTLLLEPPPMTRHGFVGARARKRTKFWKG